MPAETKRKMNRGNVFACLSKAKHHLTPSTLSMMLLMDPFEAPQILEYRQRIITEEIEEAIKRLRRIEEIAQSHGYEEILSVLNEEFEFGHDMPNSAG